MSPRDGLCKSYTFWLLTLAAGGILSAYAMRVRTLLNQVVDDKELVILCKNEKNARLIRDLCHESAQRLDKGVPFVDAFTSIVNDFLFGIYLFFQAIIDWLVSYKYLWAAIAMMVVFVIYRFIVAIEKGIKKGNPNKAARMLMQFRNYFTKPEPYYKPPPPVVTEVPMYQRPAVMAKSLPTEQNRFIGYNYVREE